MFFLNLQILTISKIYTTPKILNAKHSLINIALFAVYFLTTLLYKIQVLTIFSKYQLKCLLSFKFEVFDAFTGQRIEKRALRHVLNLHTQISPYIHLV